MLEVSSHEADLKDDLNLPDTPELQERLRGVEDGRSEEAVHEEELDLLRTSELRERLTILLGREREENMDKGDDVNIQGGGVSWRLERAMKEALHTVLMEADPQKLHPLLTWRWLGLVLPWLLPSLVL